MVMALSQANFVGTSLVLRGFRADVRRRGYLNTRFALVDLVFALLTLASLALTLSGSGFDRLIRKICHG